MALETFGYIDSLVVTNPEQTDPKNQGDNHLRGIKTALKNSFPNISGPVTVTQQQINKVVTDVWAGTVPAPEPTQTVSVISSNTIAARSYVYVCTGALTLTLPPSPADGDWLKVIDQSNSRLVVIARNGSKIYGLNEDMTLDMENIFMTLLYTGSTYGWVIA